jgi:hypothetical protein
MARYLEQRAELIVLIPEQLSLKCRAYGDRKHVPCSGTTDDGNDSPCLHWCHAPRRAMWPWSYFLEHRRAWLEELADRWQLVRRPDALTDAEREHQADRIDHAMGLKFYPTYPLPGFTVSVPRNYFASAVGEMLEPGAFLRAITDAMIHGACTNLRLDGEEAERFDPATDPPFTWLSWPPFS